MLWGEPWGCCFGDPDELVMSLDIEDLGDGPRVRVQINPDVRTGSRIISDGFWGAFIWGDDWGGTSEDYNQTYSQFIRLIVDGKYQGPYVWAEVGKTVELLGTWGKNSGDHVVSIQLNGDSNDTNNAHPNQNDAFLETRADRIKVDVTAVPSFESSGDSGQLASWSLSGMQRFTNVRPVDLFPNWARLEVTLIDTGGTRAVTLSQNGREVASGSRAGDGTITLAESNGSGLSGSVDVTYSGDVTSGSDLTIRWPKAFAIHYQKSAFTAPDFPRTPEAILVDDGRNNSRTYRSPQLASGTWRIVAHQRDANGNESAGLAGGGDSVDLVTPPDAPTGLAYVSGDAEATIIEWDDVPNSNICANVNLWSSYGSASNAINTVISPSGAQTGNTITDPSSDAWAHIYDIIDADELVDDLQYCFSAWVKEGTSSTFSLELWDSVSGTRARTDFEWASGRPTVKADDYGAGYVVGASVNGWYRVYVVCPANVIVGANIHRCRFYATEAGVLSGGSKNIYVWGARLEQDVLPTSFYIYDSKENDIMHMHEPTIVYQ